jgi:hypothetical protein
MAEDRHSPESEDQAKPEGAAESGSTISDKTGQIPLLDDVVYNTSLPFAKPRPRPPKPELQAQNIPRATDLFGGSPDTAVEGPMSPQYEAKDMDQAAEKLRGSTEQMVDNLVAEYSQEIVSRLKQELTSLLDELDDKPPRQDPE